MDAPNQWPPRDRQDGRVVIGIVLALVGLFLLLRVFHILPPLFYFVHPGWLALIIVGVVIGVKSNFRSPAAWILLVIGVSHLIPSFYIGDVSSRRLLLPLALLAAGLFIILRKKNTHHFRPSWKNGGECIPMQSVATDLVSIDVTFGGRKEIVTSKNFRGGAIRANFSGVELNLASADAVVNEPVVLDVYASFASVELILPSHWEVLNEIRPMMGSVEDHRVMRMAEAGVDRPKLILRGTVNLGSVELKSY